MSEKKLLTVSVAAYNAESYLREVLDPFTNLERINELEIFIIDDGGTDSTLDIAREYEKKYPGVFVPIHKENGGWGSTVNYSIKNASGKYFRLLDGDDYYNHENLKLFLDYIDTIEADVIISPFSAFIDGEKAEPVVAGTFDSSYKEGVTYSLENVNSDFTLAMHAITVKTELLSSSDVVTLKERCIYRDMEYTANILLRANSFAFFKKSVYCYRLGRDGQTVSPESYIKHMGEHEDIVYDVLKFSSQTNDINRKRLIYRLAEGAYIQQYKIYFFPCPKKIYQEKLETFDSTIKRNFPEFYNKIKLPIPYKYSQKSYFVFYYFLSTLLTIKRKIYKCFHNLK